MRSQDFNPKGKFIAKRSITCQGKRFTRGMAFPWRRMSISPRRLRLLFDSNKIMHPEDDMAPEPTPDPIPDPPMVEEEIKEKVEDKAE